MPDEIDEEMGPVDWLVVEFPSGTNSFTAEMARELAILVDTELVRILDLMIVAKNADGEVDVVEFEDLPDAVTSSRSRADSPRCWPSRTSSTSPRPSSPGASRG